MDQKLLLALNNLSENEIDDKVIYLPNYYPIDVFKTKIKEEKESLDKANKWISDLRNSLIEKEN